MLLNLCGSLPNAPVQVQKNQSHCNRKCCLFLQFIYHHHMLSSTSKACLGVRSDPLVWCWILSLGRLWYPVTDREDLSFLILERRSANFPKNLAKSRLPLKLFAKSQARTIEIEQTYRAVSLTGFARITMLTYWGFTLTLKFLNTHTSPLSDQRLIRILSQCY